MPPHQHPDQKPDLFPDLFPEQFSDPFPDQAPALPAWSTLGPGALSRWPLPALANRFERTVLRLAVMLARRQVWGIEGWERVLPVQDPFILVPNHSSRREVLYLVAALMLARGGRPVHFLADWSFRLIPGVGWLYDRSGAITVSRKDARPRFLNRFRTRYAAARPPLEQARARLMAGGSVGVFPEGTVNRDPLRLLRGRHGAARLSLQLGVPILPAGIDFARRGGGARQDTWAPMLIRFGAPLVPPTPAPGTGTGGTAPPSPAEVRAWHARVMNAIAGLCGKHWPDGATTETPLPTPLRSIAMQNRAAGPGDPVC